jgi:hypothetical protein
MPHVGAGLQPGVRRIPFIIGIVLEMPKESRATIDGMPSQDVAVPTLLQPLQTKFSPTRLDVALNKVVYTRVMEMSESVERTALRLTVGDFLLSDRSRQNSLDKSVIYCYSILHISTPKERRTKPALSLFLRQQKTRCQRNLNQAKSTLVKVHLNKRL